MKSCLLLALGAIAFAAPRPDPAYRSIVVPFLEKYCVACHNARLKTANLDLERFRDPAVAAAEPDTWDDILGKLRAGQMPPKGLPRPEARQMAAVTGWIDKLLRQSARTRPGDPGRLTAHRLNRFEYNNAVHDLLDVDFRPGDDFPADDSGYGFDNIGDVLSLSPVLMEKYLAAAQGIAEAAIACDPPGKPLFERYRPETRARYTTSHRFPFDGTYEIRAGIAGKRPTPGVQHLKFGFWLDGRPLERFEKDFDRDTARLFTVRAEVKAGDRVLTAALADAGPGTAVDFVEIRGPFDPKPAEQMDSYKRVFACGHPLGQHTAACTRPNLANLARRAWRRPVSGAETARLARFVDMALQQGDSYEQGMRIAVAAILTSPNFLFRIEHDPKPADPSAVHPVDDFELASRLSFFLWSSLPDEELLRAAEKRTLGSEDVLAAEVRRMLADPKSGRLAENFAGQWLELRNLDSVRPDPDRFPEFDDDLRDAMKRETCLFFESIMREDRSILDFVDARYTFLNARLAKHYGIPGVEGDEFRRVELDGTERSGVLTQASILTVTSYPNRTSPVLRGKFLLENVLNTPPPPPPPDAGVLDESQINVNGTVREQFEKHRSQPACAACHVRMDPLGFAFENYDAVGRWRTHEGRFSVDASGALPGGKPFTGAAGLKSLLKEEKDAFARCLAEKMLTYALGRGLERYDRPAVDRICRTIASSNYRFSGLVLGIVNSAPFRMGRGDGGER